MHSFFLSVLGESGGFLKTNLGIISTDLKEQENGCFYSYGKYDGTGFDAGPVLCAKAAGRSVIQIKATNRGSDLYFRVKSYDEGTWSDWKQVALK